MRLSSSAQRRNNPLPLRHFRRLLLEHASQVRRRPDGDAGICEPQVDMVVMESGEHCLAVVTDDVRGSGFLPARWLGSSTRDPRCIPKTGADGDGDAVPG